MNQEQEQIERVAAAIFTHFFASEWPPYHEVDCGMGAADFRAAAIDVIGALGISPNHNEECAVPKKSIGDHIEDIRRAASHLNALLTAAEADGYEVYDGANGLGRELNFSITVSVGPENKRD